MEALPTPDTHNASGEGSSGNMGWLLVAGGLATIGMFVKGNWDREGRWKAMKRLKPLSAYNFPTIVVVNGTDEIVAIVQHAFASLVGVSVEVRSVTLQLVSGCDAERGSISACTTIARQQAAEAFDHIKAPCVVYKQCIMVDGAERELLTDVSDAMKPGRGGAGRTVDVAHIIAWTMEGGHAVEHLVSTVTGVVRTHPQQQRRVTATASSSLYPASGDGTTLADIVTQSMRLSEESAVVQYGDVNGNAYTRDTKSTAPHWGVALPYAPFAEVALRLELRQQLREHVSLTNFEDDGGAFTRQSSPPTFHLTQLVSFMKRRIAGEGRTATSTSQEGTPSIEGRWIVEWEGAKRIAAYHHLPDAVTTFLELIRYHHRVVRPSARGPAINLLDKDVLVYSWEFQH